MQYIGSYLVLAILYVYKYFIPTCELWGEWGSGCKQKLQLNKLVYSNKPGSFREGNLVEGGYFEMCTIAL